MQLHKILLISLFLIACSVKATPGPLSPNVTPPAAPQGNARIVGFEVPEGAICAHYSGTKDFCVTGMRESLGPGFTALMGRFFTASTAPDAYSAEFRFLELSQRPTPAKNGSAVATEIAMRWRFMLKDGEGKVRVDVSESTIGPEQMINQSSANRTVTVLLNAVLERVGKAITDAKLDPSAAATDAAPTDADGGAPAPGSTKCVPGATQECVGAGACKGGQSCLPDGAGFSPCNCGAAPAEPPPSQK